MASNAINGITLTPRPQTPPSYLTPRERGIITPDFNSFKPKDVKAQSSIKEPVMQCAWNLDGQRLATCGHEKCVRLWQPEKTLVPKDTTATSGGHTAIATAVAWSPKHPELFCSSSENDKTLVFWDARKKGPTHQLKTPHAVSHLRYAPSGESVGVLDQTSTFSEVLFKKLPVDAQTWELSETTVTKLEGVTDFKFNHPGDLAFLSTKSGSLGIVEYPSMNVLDTFTAHLAACNTLDLDPRGTYMATGGSDGIINIWNNVEGIIHSAICVTDLPVFQLSYSFDGEYLAVGVGSSDILIVSSVSGQLLHRGIKQVGTPACVTWHPSKYIIASCGDHATTSAGKSGWISVVGLPQ